MQHHFDIEIAEKHGLVEAILLDNFWFWINKNEANEKNCYDGEYWTYNSTKALTKLFPYLSQRKIQNALGRLIENGILITGNYNQSAYDRTLWYAFTEKGKSIMQKREMEDDKKANGKCEKGKPIPDNKQDIKHIIKHLNEKAGTHYRDTTDATIKVINARLKEKFTVDDFKTVIDKKVAQWKGTNMEEYLRPQTLFGSKFESYLNQTINKEEKPVKSPIFVLEPPKYKELTPDPEIETSQMPEDMRNKYRGFINEL